MTIADYIAVSSDGRLDPLVRYEVVSRLHCARRSDHVDLVGRCKTVCATQVLTF
jgi:hypothetical protein